MPTPIVRPYGFDKGLEQAIAFYTCTSPQFYGRVGTHIEVDALSLETSRLLVQAAHVMAKERGKGPDSSVLVLQRLNRWMDDGKIDENQVLDCQDLLDDATREGLPSEGSLIDELVPVFKKRMHFAAAKLANKRVADGNEDMDGVSDLLSQADTMGDADVVDKGTALGDDAFTAISEMRGLIRLPTGIPDLDVAFEGGLPKGQLGVAVGDTGDGKSMFLAHVGASAFMANKRVAYATLELPRPLVLARLIANISGIPINALVNGHVGDARAKLNSIAGRDSKLIVREFTPQATKVSEIFDWIDKVADDDGKKIDLLLVDYADKLQSDKRDEDGYTGMRRVYEGLRIGGVQRDLWEWTASQSRRKDSKSKKKVKDINDLADSQHKARVADVVITLNVEQQDLDDELLEVTFFIAKNRTGQGRRAIGPLVTDFACGRMVVT